MQSHLINVECTQDCILCNPAGCKYSCQHLQEIMIQQEVNAHEAGSDVWNAFWQSATSRGVMLDQSQLVSLSIACTVITCTAGLIACLIHETVLITCGSPAEFIHESVVANDLKFREYHKQYSACI